MFSNLKSEIRKRNSINDSNDLILESVHMADVRDLFIDVDSIDENDPKLERIIDELPEGESDCCEDEADKVIESYIGGI